jgi:hypothetical protein
MFSRLSLPYLSGDDDDETFEICSELALLSCIRRADDKSSLINLINCTILILFIYLFI